MPQFVPEFPAQWTTVLNAYQIGNETSYVLGGTYNYGYPSSGMVNHYKFDDASGSTWIDSLTGNTLTSGYEFVSVAGKFGTAAQIANNVGGDIIVHGSLSNYTFPDWSGQWSVSFWVNIAGLTQQMSPGECDYPMMFVNGGAVCFSSGSSPSGVMIQYSGIGNNFRADRKITSSFGL